MQHKHPRGEGDSAAEAATASSVRSLRLRNAGSSDTAEPAIGRVDVFPSHIDTENVDPNDLNGFFNDDYKVQTPSKSSGDPHTTPIIGILQDTPSTLLQPSRSLQSPDCNTSALQYPQSGLQTPVQKLMAPFEHMYRYQSVLHVQAPAICDSSMQIEAELSQPGGFCPFLGFTPVPFGATFDDRFSGVDEHEPALVCETPGRAAPAPVGTAHSPIGKMSQMYIPKMIGRSATPETGNDRGAAVPCHCPEPSENHSLKVYRVLYPHAKPICFENGKPKYFEEGMPKIFENAIHGGATLEEVELPVDSKPSQASAKKKIPNFAETKPFKDGYPKKGGVTPKHADPNEYECVDVQLRSSHHPQYCLQFNNFLPRIHELRHRLGKDGNIHELWRHVCPTVLYKQGCHMDEAIPRLLLLPKLQDSWAIALLVRFTTFMNPMEGVQTARCLMALASEEFQNRSGNHIMLSAMPFGAVFNDVPLPPACFTNRSFPQLVMCHNIHPLVDMNMKTIRQCIIQQLGYLESDTFSISQKDCHMYYIGPFYFRKTLYQVSLHRDALGHITPEEFDNGRLEKQIKARMQFYCQHMRSKGCFAQSLPHNSPVLTTTPTCACGLPLQTSDLDCPLDGPRYSPCEELRCRKMNDTATAADNQHWSDIHTALPVGPGERRAVSVELRDTPQPAPLSLQYLNIGELTRWVLLRGPNLEDESELLRHDILWHFVPHKSSWQKEKKEEKSATSTPRSKTSTPLSTPRAGGGAAALSRANFSDAAFSSQDSDTATSTGSGGLATSHSASSARKRSEIPRFSSSPHSSTDARKKLTLDPKP